MNDQEFEQILLQSAREDAPLDDGHAAWARLAGGLAAIASRSAPAGDRRRPETSAAPIPGRGAAGATKWLLLGAIGGSALTAAVMLHVRARPASAPAGVAVSAPAVTPSRPTVEPTAVAETPEAALAATHPKHPGRAHPRALHGASGAPASEAGSPSDLAAEVSRIDAARTASAAGNHDEAVWLIERYHREFPDGSLAPDADVVALEAVAAKGDRAETTRRAILFLSRYPDDPHAARVRWLADHLGSESR